MKKATDGQGGSIKADHQMILGQTRCHMRLTNRDQFLILKSKTSSIWIHLRLLANGFSMNHSEHIRIVRVHTHIFIFYTV